MSETSVTVEVCPSCGHNIWHASLVAQAAFCAQCDREPVYRWDTDDHAKVTLACPVHGDLMRMDVGRVHAPPIGSRLYERAEDAAEPCPEAVRLFANVNTTVHVEMGAHRWKDVAVDSCGRPLGLGGR